MWREQTWRCVVNVVELAQFFKLDFQSVSTDSLHTTMFGGPTTETLDETVKLCQHCARYNDNPNRHKDWSNAWPSVMYTFFLKHIGLIPILKNCLKILHMK